jgi:outer membrane protein OmpA-like peptidoglycan-associated protein
MRTRHLMLPLVLIIAAGCQTTVRPEVVSVPTARDYATLSETTLDEAEAALAAAEERGAASSSPYEYEAARLYLERARLEQQRGHRAGLWDYAGLSVAEAETALRDSPAASSSAAPLQLTDMDACDTAFESLKARYRGMNAGRASDASPVLFARATVALSSAEHELLHHRNPRIVAPLLQSAHALMESLAASDIDEDGVPDLEDAAPRLPEDVDRFEDDDGAPDLDNDEDGIPDVADTAPLEPETVNGWHDHDGAPDSPPALETIHFDSGSTTLTADAKGYLRGLASILRESRGLKLHIRGYSDNAHSAKYNLDLSRRRAMRVHSYLQQIQIQDEQLLATFYGESEPAGDNNTADGRAMNRRVELVFE